MAPRISIFSIVLVAGNLFYVKSIATYAPTFFGYIVSVLASVISRHYPDSYRFLKSFELNLRKLTSIFQIRFEDERKCPKISMLLIIFQIIDTNQKFRTCFPKKETKNPWEIRFCGLMFRIGHSSDKKGTNTVMGYVAPRFLYRTMVSKIYMVSPQNIKIKTMLLHGLFVCFKGQLSLLPEKSVLICSIPQSHESPLWNPLLRGRFRGPGFDPFYRIIETGLIYLGSFNPTPLSDMTSWL